MKCGEDSPDWSIIKSWNFLNYVTLFLSRVWRSEFLVLLREGPLANGDLVSEAEGESLSLAANANVPDQSPSRGLLDALVGQGVLPKDAASVEVGGQEIALSLQGILRS